MKDILASLGLKEGDTLTNPLTGEEIIIGKPLQTESE